MELMLNRLTSFIHWRRVAHYWGCVVNIHFKAEDVVYYKYASRLHPSGPLTPETIEDPDLHILAKDKLFSEFAFEVSNRMDVEGVKVLSDLSTDEKCKLVRWAVSFDLLDHEFAAFLKLLKTDEQSTCMRLRSRWKEACDLDDNRWKHVSYDALSENEKQLRIKAVHNANDVAEAYQMGLSTLREDRFPGGPRHSVFYLLPCGVLRARTAGSGQAPCWADAPDFASLTGREEDIVTYIFEAVSCGVSGVGVLSLMEKVEPILTEKLLSLPEITAIFEHSIRAAFEQEQDQQALNYGLSKNVESSRVRADVFETVQYVFEGWP